MRCYFMRDGHIGAVEMLQPADDKAIIEQARSLFKELGPLRTADGFEVWDGPRFVYRFPETP